MIDAAEYTKLTVAAWIEMLERWTPDPQHLVAAWCSDCVGSDFSDDIPRCRELPHDVVHAVIGAHEAAIARAEELLIALRVADLQSDWQMRTTPEFFGDEGFDIEYLTELQAEFLARQRWEADNIATWRDDTLKSAKTCSSQRHFPMKSRSWRMAC